MVQEASLIAILLLGAPRLKTEIEIKEPKEIGDLWCSTKARTFNDCISKKKRPRARRRH